MVNLLKCDDCGRWQEFSLDDYYHMVSHKIYTNGEYVWLCGKCNDEIVEKKIRKFKES